jgi:hypothetical protein
VVFLREVFSDISVSPCEIKSGRSMTVRLGETFGVKERVDIGLCLPPEHKQKSPTKITGRAG